MKSSLNCKGSLAFGNGCGLCGKCISEISRMKREREPDVTEQDLDNLEAKALNPHQFSIVQLARVGLWAEKNSVEIDDALRAAQNLPTPRRKSFEKTLNSRPRK
jgi:hypothetical protein